MCSEWISCENTTITLPIISSTSRSVSLAMRSAVVVGGWSIQ